MNENCLCVAFVFGWSFFFCEISLKGFLRVTATNAVDRERFVRSRHKNFRADAVSKDCLWQIKVYGT